MSRGGLRLGILAIMTATMLAACATGKKPVRKNVRIDKNAITKRYGANSVDTGAAMGNQVTGTQPAPSSIGLNDKKKELIKVLLPLWNRQLNFRTFSGKAKMHYDARGQKQDFTAHIRIAKDKVIWVSITALGGVVNVARAYITPDSIMMVNYLNKEAYRMPITSASKLLPAPVDFSTLQNLIVGNVLRQVGKPTDATDFGGTMSLQMEDQGIIQQAAYNKTDSSLRSMQILSHDDKGPTGMIQYGNYENVGQYRFAGSRVINVSNNGEPYYMDMNFNGVEFDNNLDYPFSIPKSYTIKSL